MFPELISTHVQQAKATEAILNRKGCLVTGFRQTRTPRLRSHALQLSCCWRCAYC
jgi:hypothetical protein